MNKEVNRKLALLLKEKGYNEKCDNWAYLDSNCMSMSYDPKTCVKMPSIADVVTWLYEKYKIWISVDINISSEWYYTLTKVNDKYNYIIHTGLEGDKKSINNAYESAIEYTLKILI